MATDAWRDILGEDRHMKMDVEFGVMLSQAMGHMEPPEAGREAREDSCLEPSEGLWP